MRRLAIGSRAYTKKWAAERLAQGGPVREEWMSGQASDPSKRFATSKELGGFLGMARGVRFQSKSGRRPRWLPRTCTFHRDTYKAQEFRKDSRTHPLARCS
jgi:hypothetical protein